MGWLIVVFLRGMLYFCYVLYFYLQQHSRHGGGVSAIPLLMCNLYVSDMRFYWLNIGCAICIALLSIGCSGSNGDKNEIKGAPICIDRLDRSLFNYSRMSEGKKDSMLSDNKAILLPYLEILDVSPLNDSTLQALSGSRMVKMFAAETDSLYADLSAEEQGLGNMLARAEDQGIKFSPKRYVACVWGLPQSIIFNDNVMYVALNHYLGVDHRAYAGMPEYMRRLKNRKNLPYDMLEALVSTDYPMKNDSHSVLDHLLYQGVIAEAKMKLIDNASLSDALGFSEDQMKDIAANERFMWERLLKDDMLHTTDPIVISMLFDNAPVCSIISPDAPGRAARYIGYRIVESYIDTHPDAKLSQLLSPEFYMNRSILAESGYTPR